MGLEKRGDCGGRKEKKGRRKKTRKGKTEGWKGRGKGREEMSSVKK